MTDQPTPSRRQLWDERHGRHDPIESLEPEPTLAQAVDRWVPGRALDLATGDGRNAIFLARRGWQVTAVDFSQVALNRARRTAETVGQKVDWILADLLEWRPASQAFDLVTVVFLHLPTNERRQVLAVAAEAVAPGGRLFVIGHDRTNLTEGSGGPQNPALLFTAADIAADLVGFTVERAERVIHDQPDGRRMIDAVLVAVRRLA